MYVSKFVLISTPIPQCKLWFNWKYDYIYNHGDAHRKEFTPTMLIRTMLYLYSCSFKFLLFFPKVLASLQFMDIALAAGDLEN